MPKAVRRGAPQLRRGVEEGAVGRVGAGPAALDVVDAEGVEGAGDPAACPRRRSRRPGSAGRRAGWCRRGRGARGSCVDRRRASQDRSPGRVSHVGRRRGRVHQRSIPACAQARPGLRRPVAKSRARLARLQRSASQLDSAIEHRSSLAVRRADRRDAICCSVGSTAEKSSQARCQLQRPSELASSARQLDLPSRPSERRRESRNHAIASACSDRRRARSSTARLGEPSSIDARDCIADAARQHA